MTETLKNLYDYLSANREKALTDIDCVNNVDGITYDNVMQLLEELESKGKIDLDSSYTHPSITVI